MCFLCPLACCGCSSSKPCQKKGKQQQVQHQPDVLANVISQEPGYFNQVTTSQQSLPSMSPSAVSLPHQIDTSSTLSSLAGEVDLYDMEAWWLKRASIEDYLSIVSQRN
ncbi:uncharacterized protein LOC27207984 [Drosophila simulans]|uniref:uncharacterized protein LOC27207984 n=1 Tax=Drosophila simulans TaxID=7240 RepID=UPI00078AEAA8|nr:uncharacterized protein LOC27207984 [Drosophila simulans]KMZ07571.1 uncharacterized protein Dsimw501_GD28135 [Drosophila simulans]